MSTAQINGMPEGIVGALGFATMVVRPGDTAAANGIGDLTVVNNAALVSLMESAAIAAINEFFETGISTISTSMNCNFVTSAAIGAELQASAQCIAQNGYDMDFNIEIYEGERLVAQSTQRRQIVDRVTFLARTAAQSLFEAK
ncbi:MAG: thioesterase family protein [Candidatus Nanopelagicaceae bacterium]